MDSKIDLRIKAKSIRKYLNISKISSLAVSKIRDVDIYKEARNVLIFYPMRYEIDLLALLALIRKSILLSMFLIYFICLRFLIKSFLYVLLKKGIS